MQSRKVVLVKLIAVALCAVVLAIALSIPFTLQQKKIESVSAASSCSLTITFTNFPTKINGYAVLSFTYIDSESGSVKTISELFTASDTTASNTINKSMNIGGVGKLEINCPLYSTISVTGQTAQDVGKDGKSFATYDFTSAPTSLTITIEFEDKGWFGGTTIV